ncbi:N-acyl-D-amino-acid deacylase [Elysia marginata]|uniref:N-acyl-D-amino-acid deacylase n=1 Tax=Elysia marginata TaxID=1093978 RepID=A0AAV4ERE8_9GAST|nr:N-acyl-D-amino-acid deacylase [Elysia marginata]
MLANCVDHQDHSYSVLSGDQQPNGDTKARWKCFDNIISKFLVEQRIPGASVAISRHEKIIYKQGYGIAGCSRRVHPDSVFRIASISKPITAAVVLHVCKEANVSLDRPVFGRQGTWHAYSNLGYLALGEVVEEITQKPYKDVLQDFLQKLCIPGVAVGQRGRSDWDGLEVEYFNNKDPNVVESLYPNEGLVLPQYGGMAMPSSASYGGLIADTSSLLQFLYCMELSVSASLPTELMLFQTVESPKDWESMLDDTTNSTNFQEQSASVEGNLPQMLCEKSKNSLSEKHQNNSGSCGDFQAVPLMSFTQAKETLSRPRYELPSAGDWYGLGWDVQDNGTTWGHTGGMEGTCGTLYHHGQSGLNWAFLLNSWAQDCDLNGVMKSGLMMTDLTSEKEDGSPVFTGLESLTWTCCKRCSSHSGAIKVVTENRCQVILLNTTESEVLEVLPEMKRQSYFVTWFCCMSQQLGADLETKEILKSDDCSHQKKEKSQTYSFKALEYNTCSCQKYCFIFTQTSLTFIDYTLIFNMQAQELKDTLCEYKDKGYFITFLDSYCSNSSLRFNAVFSLDGGHAENCPKSSSFSTVPTPVSDNTSYSNTTAQQSSHSASCIDSVTQKRNVGLEKTEVYLTKKAREYVRFARSMVDSYWILVQTVTEIDRDLWVSVVLKPKTLRHHAPHHSAKGDAKYRRANKRKSFSKTNDSLTCSRLSNDSLLVRKVTRSQTSKALPTPERNLSQSKLVDSLQEDHPHDGFTSSKTKFMIDPVSNTKISKFKKSVGVQDSVYWVQITPESFLTELHRQIQKGRSLKYTKFYTVSGKPYVSAVWTLPTSGTDTNCFLANTSVSKTCPQTSYTTQKCPGSGNEPDLSSMNNRYHRTAMSKYGLLPELAEAASKNLVLQSLSEYSEEDGSVYYAAIWFA